MGIGLSRTKGLLGMRGAAVESADVAVKGYKLIDAIARLALDGVRGTVTAQDKRKAHGLLASFVHEAGEAIDAVPVTREDG